jgi:hypothetical protein
VRIEFTKIDNEFITVCRVLQKGRGSVKIYKRFVKGKRY